MEIFKELGASNKTPSDDGYFSIKQGEKIISDETRIMLITTRQKKRVRLDENLFTLTYNDVILQLTKGDKILGVSIEQNLLWNNHLL